jgi:hypothetical protein
LAAPLVAAAFMLHLFEGLRRDRRSLAGSYGPVADG